LGAGRFLALLIRLLRDDGAGADEESDGRATKPVDSHERNSYVRPAHCVGAYNVAHVISSGVDGNQAAAQQATGNPHQDLTQVRATWSARVLQARPLSNNRAAPSRKGIEDDDFAIDREQRNHHDRTYLHLVPLPPAATS
jgi:hypothetical protein